MKSQPTLFDPLPVPTFDREDELHAGNIARVAGTDEAGRGPLAGPVVAGAALLPRAFAVEFFGQINDSKQLSARTRERLSAEIKAHAQWGLGVCDAAEIDEINIRRASWLAMRRAVEDLVARFGAVDTVLVDGLPVREMEWPWPYQTIIRGDTLSLSIAAASILAKVARDEWMREFDAQFPGYGFAAHKGYPTRAHYAALRELGPCEIHRRTFAPVRAAIVRAGLKFSKIRGMTYADGLLETKKDYPFEEWRTYIEDGLEQYTEENCRAAAAILDRLISNLITLGENAGEDEKIRLFHNAVESLNELNDGTLIIETGEREQLVPLFNRIARKAGIEVGEFDDTLTEERDW